MSKLLSLVLVLALVGVVSAANNQWQGPQTDAPAGNWNVASNWSLGRAPLNSQSDTVLLHHAVNYANGLGSNIYVDDAQEGGAKTRLYFGGPLLLEIRSTGSLTTLGSVDGTNTNSTMTIRQGGVWSACTVTNGAFKVASMSGVYDIDVAVNVYGTLNVKGAASALLDITSDTRGTTSAGNTGTVNIYSTGVVDVGSYIIGNYGTGRINFIGGTGKMYVKGDVVAQAIADINAGKITGVSASQVYYHSAAVGTVIPEPATLALLGLGGLLLRRKR